MGHTKSQCDRVQAYRKKHFGQRAQKGAHHLEAEDHLQSDEQMLDHLDDISVNNLCRSNPYKATVLVNNKGVEMELDTGSPWTIMSKEQFSSVNQGVDLKPSRIRLKSYTGDSVSILGEAEVQVQFDPQEKTTTVELIGGPKRCGPTGKRLVGTVPRP